MTVQRDHFVVVVYENHHLAQKASVELSELADEPFILGMPSGWQHYHDHLQKVCREAGFMPKTVQHAFNTEGIFGLISCEMGITIHTTCAENILRKGLVIRPIRDLDETLPTIAAWTKTESTPTQKLFINFLLNRMKA